MTNLFLIEGVLIGDGPVEFTGARGSDIRIPCNAVGTPAPDVLWIYGGGVLAIDGVKYDQGEDNSITVREVTSNDVGDYVCIARNVISSASKTLTLKIKGDMCNSCVRS